MSIQKPIFHETQTKPSNRTPIDGKTRDETKSSVRIDAAMDVIWRKPLSHMAK